MNAHPKDLSYGRSTRWIEAFLETRRPGEKEELGDLAALKGIIQTPNRIRRATLARDAFVGDSEVGRTPPDPCVCRSKLTS